jgi:hypothetical protein
MIIEYLKKIRNFLVSWFADIRFYNFGLILWGVSSYKIKGPQMRQILDCIQPGDVLLRKYDHYLGSVLISGFWSHAAVYIGDNKIVHMLGEGIITEDILTFMRCDHIMILRHKDRYLATRIVDRAKDFSNKKIEYDYDFNLKDSKAMYCTEFVDVCADGIIHASLKNTKYILPDDFLKCPSFNKIWTDVVE